MPDLTISVVMCAYTERRWDDLLHAMSALQQQTRRADEVVLVVDHNPVLLDRALAQFPEITIVENAAEPGLSGARNTGVSASTGEVVAFIDEDAMAAPDWLERMEARYSDPSLLGVGGPIEPRWMSGRPWWFPEEFQWVVGCTYVGMPDDVSPVRNLIGCNMSIRRDVLDAIGAFRIGRVGALSIGFENDDTEMCIRARSAFPGSQLIYDPAVRVVNHRVPASRSAMRYFVKRCFSEGMSKARLSKLVGAEDGLSNERQYVLHALPRGVGRGLRDAARGQVAGLGRAGAIVIGVSVTSAGFVAGKLFGPVLERRPSRLT